MLYRQPGACMYKSVELFDSEDTNNVLKLAVCVVKYFVNLEISFI